MKIICDLFEGGRVVVIDRAVDLLGASKSKKMIEDEPIYIDHLQ